MLSPSQPIVQSLSYSLPTLKSRILLTITTNTNNFGSHIMSPLSSFLKGSYFTKASFPDTADKATGSSVVNLSDHSNRAEQPPPAFSNEVCPPSYTPVGVRRKIIVRRKPGQDETDYALIHAQLLEKAVRKAQT